MFADQFKKKTKLILLLVIGWNMCVASCAFAVEEQERSQIESLLCITLPKGIEDIEYEKVYSSDEFSKPYEAYIRAKMSKSTYLSLIQTLDMSLKQDHEITEYTVLLASTLGEKAAPIWWNPPKQPVGISGVGEFQSAENYGWIISTYHEGYAYFKIFEQGDPS